MLKFVKHIVCVLVVTVLFAFVIDKGIFEFFYKVHKRTKLDITGLKKDVVFFGSSRCIHHVNPVIIDSLCHTNSFNMGWAASNPREIYAAVKIYLARNSKPKLICIQVDMEHDDTTEDELARQSLLKFYGKDKVEDYYSVGLKNEMNIPLLPSILYRDFGWREISKIAIKNHYDINNEGFTPLFGNKTFAVKDIEINRKSLLVPNPWISKTIELCNKNNINTILFTAPIYNLKNGFRFNNIANLYKCKYYNYSDSLQNKSLFFDQTHLNENGARCFSLKLARIIE